MPYIAVEGARVRCSHGMGFASPQSSRRFLRFAGRRVLVAPDMPANGVRLCPHRGPTVKPCQSTLPLTSGVSRFVFANNAPVVLEGATGGTDGVPPGVTTYTVRAAGQGLVSAGG